MEMRYGKGNINRLVKRYHEETSNAEWFKKSTTECPGCLCRVEKNTGCNHASDIPFQMWGVVANLISTGPVDDVLEVWEALLLPVRRSDLWERPVRAFQQAWVVLPEIIRPQWI